MKVLIVLLMATGIYCIDPSCDFFQRLEVGKVYTIEKKANKQGKSFEEDNEVDSLEGARNFWPFRFDVSCRFAIEAPIGYNVKMICSYSNFKNPKGTTCSTAPDTLKISRRGLVSMQDADTYCGKKGKLSLLSLSTKTIIEFAAKVKSYARFVCRAYALEDTCTCGVPTRKFVGKVVGGVPAQLNEYPMMAAIKLTPDARVVHCGGTIISTQHILSAAHCFVDVVIANMRVHLGDHNITSLTESRYMQVHTIDKVISHENFNADTNDNDIALVFLKDKIIYTAGVSRGCLPFRYRTRIFNGEQVEGIGWGTTEFSGPPSEVLRKVSLNVEINPLMCNNNQICTYAEGKDLCQRDSGGPIFFEGPLRNLYQIGIVSNGIACGGIDPSVNTKVANYLDWIQEKTMPTVYCAR